MEIQALTELAETLLCIWLLCELCDELECLLDEELEE